MTQLMLGYAMTDGIMIDIKLKRAATMASPPLMQQASFAHK